MHQHFYHWHGQADLIHEPGILEARWNAASSFELASPAADLCSLIRLAIFSEAAPEFNKRFSEELVKLEPTFPPRKNRELLKIMATVVLYEQLEENSKNADATALGIAAAVFSTESESAVCTDLLERVRGYLDEESNKVRPTPNSREDLKELKKILEEGDLEEGDLEEESEPTLLLGKVVQSFGESLECIAEENQFLWWLVGKQSPILQERRETLSPEQYAMVAAKEAADRVNILPPPNSILSLLSEALSQCAGDPQKSTSLLKQLTAASSKMRESDSLIATTAELTPLSSAHSVVLSGGKIDANTLKKFRLPPRFSCSPLKLSVQYFRELMFFRALHHLE